MTEALGTDLAFMNRGGIRDTLPEGTILARHVWNMMPFDNRIVIGRFHGSELPPSITAGRSIDPNREYTLAVSDFVGTNQRTELGTTGLVFPQHLDLLHRDLVIDWIRAKKVLE